MIELKCTMDVDLENEVISKSYVRKFNSESITIEELDQFFQAVKDEFLDYNEE